MALMSWNPADPIEKQKRIAWSVATECAVVTKEDPVLIYKRLMKENERQNISACDTNET